MARHPAAPPPPNPTVDPSSLYPSSPLLYVAGSSHAHPSLPLPPASSLPDLQVHELPQHYPGAAVHRGQPPPPINVRALTEQAAGESANGGSPLARTPSGKTQKSPGKIDLGARMKAYERQMEEEKNSDWKRRIFGIGPKVGYLPESHVIHPLSLFAKVMTSLSSLFLLYTALITPVIIGFFWFQDSCTRQGTLEVDMLVDTFFLCEIVYTFFLGTYVGGHVYVHDPASVARIYLSFQFWFDLVTSIPVSYVEYAALQQCESGRSAIDPQGIRIIRFIKPFRLIRMLRLIRTQNLFAMFDYIEQVLHLPPFLLKMTRLLFLIFGCVHIVACLFWLIKTSSRSQAEVDIFLSENGVYDDDLLHKYILSNYFINTCFTTVGFGEIHPENTSERVFVVATMYIGTLVFGTMLAEVQQAMAHLRRFARDKADSLQKIVDFLREKHTPVKTVSRFMAWADYDMTVQISRNNQDHVIKSLPETLQDELIKILSQDRLAANPVFLFMRSAYKDQLLLDLWQAMYAETYEKDMLIASGEEDADRMFLVTHGTVKMEDATGAAVATLRPDDFFGTYSLFGYADYGLDKSVEGAGFTALQMCTVMVLTREAFEAVLGGYDEVVRNSLLSELTQTVEQVLHNDFDEGDEGHVTDAVQLGRWLSVVTKALARASQANRDSVSILARATQMAHRAKRGRGGRNGKADSAMHDRVDAIDKRLDSLCDEVKGVSRSVESLGSLLRAHLTAPTHPAAQSTRSIPIPYSLAGGVTVARLSEVVPPPTTFTSPSSRDLPFNQPPNPQPAAVAGSGGPIVAQLGYVGSGSM